MCGVEAFYTGQEEGPGFVVLFRERGRWRSGSARESGPEGKESEDERARQKEKPEREGRSSIVHVDSTSCCQSACGRGVVLTRRAHWLRTIWRFFSVYHVAITALQGKYRASWQSGSLVGGCVRGRIARCPLWEWVRVPVDVVHSSSEFDASRAVLALLCSSLLDYWGVVLELCAVCDVVLDVCGSFTMYSAPTRHPAAGVSF